jgi:hypothetical protein
MRPIKSSGTILETRRTWAPPAVTQLAIRTETRLALEKGQSLGLETSGSGQPRFAQPRPPAAPATKFGFSFEMSFPLSARFDS